MNTNFLVLLGLSYLVCELDAFANNKAIDGALKQVKLVAPETPTIFFSGRVILLTQFLTKFSLPN